MYRYIYLVYLYIYDVCRLELQVERLLAYLFLFINESITMKMPPRAPSFLLFVLKKVLQRQVLGEDHVVSILLSTMRKLFF